MGMASGSSKGVKNEINVTPLVDVVLVLLIIFMVITPMLQRGKDVRLPRSKSIEKDADEGDPIILSVTTDKKLWIESDSFTDKEFEAAITAKVAEEPTRRILLKGDDSLEYGDVRRAMNLTRKAGARGISLGVEEIKEKK
jgi:biopolymer transport protein TolR